LWFINPYLEQKIILEGGAVWHRNDI
jgi:hypothetical protein